MSSQNAELLREVSEEPTPSPTARDLEWFSRTRTVAEASPSSLESLCGRVAKGDSGKRVAGLRKALALYPTSSD